MRTTALGFVLAPLLGLLAMVGPVLLAPPAHPRAAPLFPLLASALKDAGLAQILFLFAAGALLGLVSSSRAWRLGLAAIALLPLAAIAEMLVDPTSHSLWPFEFAIYAVLGLVVTLGVFSVRRLRGAPASG